ncbi:hypothetical protein L228DRAFT_244167 [Xylona heveae TC161]|uniref:DNA recombination and repair protein Rad51-like C-terminal domain-containing protein n=1 Tax=Xylona heveae (strain CBS 132557 / TC161) TaxID=1328760 RepID=A0A165IT46_XYLHT|nr:hypothetical protein L228DRAFT_244167 [Xylona heveae TC161]KZF25350.1 hypothetical protein L228DRAFT_244167 [Xylona heveae TC161]
MDNMLERFEYWKAPRLAHLFALLMHPTGSFPSEGSGLIVIDCVSTLFDISFPRSGNERVPTNKDGTPKPKKEVEARQWASGRRFAVMGDLISRLSKLAALRNVAVLLVNQTTTRLRFEGSARLVSMLGGNNWDVGIWSRIVLIRDWGTIQSEDGDGHRMQGIRYAGVQKIARTVPRDEVFALKAVPFVIKQDGIHEIETNLALPDTAPPDIPSGSQKRKHDEIADSQSEDGDMGSDEDYGWVDEDEIITENEAANAHAAEAMERGPITQET